MIPIKFQADASTQIVGRFEEYRRDPLLIDRHHEIPFYQNLSAITGAGKTLILADTVEAMRSCLPLEPVVLWLSKGRVVVEQTFVNLTIGKYAPFIGSFAVKPLLDCRLRDLEDGSRGLLLVATVGKFAEEDKEKSDLRVYNLRLDSANQVLWKLLERRVDDKGRRRPLIVVYDEGHNLSNMQTRILLELGPNALIAASATMNIPDALANTITRLRQDRHWSDEQFVTAVPSSKVVEAGLVKKHIMLGGYVTPMEAAVDDLLADMSEAGHSAAALGLPFRPKAIYVATTNTVDGTSIKDDVARPFRERRARPILIWRHLVENADVDPATIAVYCRLKFDPKRPSPASFNLFAGADSDYSRFIAGRYRHVIFNHSLQEGWDDPECAFAYIDKDMGSPGEVTQIVGRVLRQPGGQHYPSPNLNTAHFYIRTDEKGVFEAILDDVRGKLATDAPDITLTVKRSHEAGDRPYLPALKHRTVPLAQIVHKNAKEPIRDIFRATQDFTAGGVNTIGAGGRIQVLQTVGSGEAATMDWVEVEHSNRVMARWVMRREVQRLFPVRKDIGVDPITLGDIEDRKFDALIEYNSLAAQHIREQAGKIVDAYIEHSEIVHVAGDPPYVVDSVPIDRTDMDWFIHALHEGYSGLNNDEKEFAQALDKTKRVWCRNPSQGGFSIPLLDRGNTRTFNPDFLVWTDKSVVVIDTKGKHLITEDANRKLFFIRQIGSGPELAIRLVTKGKWRVAPNGTYGRISGSSGCSVWALKQGVPHPTHCDTWTAAASFCLRS